MENNIGHAYRIPIKNCLVCFIAALCLTGSKEAKANWLGFYAVPQLRYSWDKYLGMHRNDKFSTQPRNSWLLFAKGGTITSYPTLEAVSGAPGVGITAEQARRQNGWTVGARGQYRVTPILSLGWQYNFTKLNDKHFINQNAGTLPTNPLNMKFKDNEFSTVTIGMSVRFL